jgi:hypothetical protein
MKEPTAPGVPKRTAPGVPKRTAPGVPKRSPIFTQLPKDGATTTLIIKMLPAKVYGIETQAIVSSTVLAHHYYKTMYSSTFSQSLI